MMAGTQMQPSRRSGKHFTVQLAIIASLRAQRDFVIGWKIDGLTEIDQDIVVVQPPERRKESSAFRPAVLYLVAQPDGIVARIADPGGGMWRTLRSRTKSVE